MGGKTKIAKEILHIILKDRGKRQCYVEPFAGGMNVIDKVTGTRIANDSNEYLIAMWKGLQEDFIRPYVISKELYSMVRNSYNIGNGAYSSFIIGWVGFMASFNGRFFDGGYSGGWHNGKKIDEKIRNVEKQIDFLRDVVFQSSSYDELHIPRRSLIYCDPPYEGTKQYSTSKGFDHQKFWNWCREKKAEGHTIFISEYSAPEDFTCVWEKEVSTTIKPSAKNYKAVEKLFTL